MDKPKKSHSDNVIDLKERKKSQKNRKQKKGNQVKKTHKGKYTIWQYVQLLILLALGAYLMHMCRS